MGVRPVPSSPLPLLDDALDGPVGARQVGDGPKVRPAKGGLVGLLERRSDEQPVRAELVRQVSQTPLNGAVQVTHRGEVLAPRDDLLGPHRRGRQPGRPEPLSVGAFHPFRSLQVHKVLQRRLAEREQPHLYPGRVAPRLMRHVRPADIGGRPDGREQVLDHGPVQHLLSGDAEDHHAPALDGLQLLVPKAGTYRAREAERGVEVLAHQAMLKLSSLRQQIGQLLAVSHHDDRLAHSQKPIPGDGWTQSLGRAAAGSCTEGHANAPDTT